MPDQKEETENRLDRTLQRVTLNLAQKTTRRSFLAVMSKFLLTTIGVQMMAVLPIDRTVDEDYQEEGTGCGRWSYCRINAPLVCTCCLGVGQCTCPYGSQDGPYWLGCCYKPSLGVYKLIGYFDCCSPSGYLDSCTGVNKICDTWCHRHDSRSKPGSPDPDIPPDPYYYPNYWHNAAWCPNGTFFVCTTACVIGDC